MKISGARILKPEARWTRAELARAIDHTLLDPAATSHKVLMASEIARRNHTATVCLNSNRVALAAENLKGADVGIAAVVGFPFGAAHVTAKSYGPASPLKMGGRPVSGRCRHRPGLEAPSIRRLVSTLDMGQVPSPDLAEWVSRGFVNR